MDRIYRCSGYALGDIVADRAIGSRIIGTEGREWIDFEAGVWCAALGHNPPRIRRAIDCQLDLVGHIGYRIGHPKQQEASRLLLDAIGLQSGRCVFLSSGSEAVEFAAQAARLVSGKPLLLTLAESYLGAYGSVGRKTSDEWVLFDRAQCADCSPETPCSEECPYIDAISFADVGGFVLETGSSGGLIRFPPEKLIRTLCERTRAYDGLLVANEITTGFGRTGRWFGHQHYDVRPGIIAVGKGMGNGYPVSAIALREDVVAALEERGFHYAQSHQDDPLGCAIASEVMQALKDEQLVERSARLGAELLDLLQELATRHDVIRDVRGRGLMIGIEFAPDHEAFSLRSIFEGLQERGILVGYKPAANLLRLLPPLTIGESEIAQLIDALDELLG